MSKFNVKVGDDVTMLFHFMGIISEEEYRVIAVDGNRVTLNTDEDLNECKVFGLPSGRCLNDTTFSGAVRTLKI